MTLTRDDLALLPDFYKTCSSCKRSKRVSFSDPASSAFTPYPRSRDKAQAFCRQCHKRRDRVYWQARKRRERQSGKEPWAKVYPERKRALVQQRRDQGGGRIAPKLRVAVLTTYPYCLRCESTEGLTVDHVIPIVRGGITEMGNLQTLCLRCQRIKKDKATDYRPRFWARAAAAAAAKAGTPLC